MRLLIRDLAPGQQYAIRFRANNGEQVSEWSQVQRFTTTNDTIPPSQVTNLSWYDSGAAFIGEWTKVTTQATQPPSALKDFRHYRCNVSDGLKDQDFYVLRERFELTREMNIATFGSFKSALTLKVYAVDMTYNESIVTQFTANPSNPPVPSAAVLSNHYGAILVEWNGRGAGGEAMPTNLDYLELHVGLTNDFVASATTFRERLVMNRSSNTQRALLTGLTNGTTYYVRLIAVNVLGKKSSQSAISNAVVKSGLTGLEIANGQISPAQINFSAREIGGANAFYGTSQPQVGVNGVTILKAGDIWYDTDDKYATYEYDGTNWNPNTSIGVVTGTKILAGTLTSDAVGTNLLITAKANIGDALIDTGHIDQLSANVITSGMLQSKFNVSYGGVTQPAWSFDVNGNVVINNAEIKGQITVGTSSNPTASSSYAIRSYNYVAGVSGWTINGNGTVEFGSATLRGSFRTATTGRRIEIMSAGASGTIKFVAPDGDSTYIKSLTEANAQGIESLQLGVGDPAVTSWNKIVINLGHGGHLTTRANIIENVVGTDFRFFVSTSVGSLTGGSSQRLRLAKDEIRYWDNAGKTRFYINDTEAHISDQYNRVRLQIEDEITALRANHADVRFQMRNYDGYTYLMTGVGGFREFFNNGEVRFRYLAGDINFVAQGTNNMSPNITLFTGSGHGNKLQVYNDARGAWFESQWWNGGGWAGIRGSGFEVISDARTKQDIIETNTADMLTQVRSTKVKKYRRKGDIRDVARTRKVSAGETVTADGAPVTMLKNEIQAVASPSTAPVKEEIGLIAQEAPSQIVNTAEDGSVLGIELYQMTSMVWGAIQELAAQIDTLKTEIKYIKGNKK